MRLAFACTRRYSARAVSILTLVALADLPLVIAGYLFVKCFHTRAMGWVAVIAPLVYVGLGYLVVYAALILPGCPGNRWAC